MSNPSQLVEAVFSEHLLWAGDPSVPLQTFPPHSEFCYLFTGQVLKVTNLRSHSL